MKKDPFFSIIIPAYNRASFLGNTITSVLEQKFQDWEAIIIDDGSIDNTREVVLDFEDSRIKYYYKKNEERSVARNFGIDNSRGKYVCFLDSDDIYYSNHLSCLRERIVKEHYKKAIFKTGIYEKRGDEKYPRSFYKESDYTHPIYFIWEKFILINSICVHREILEYHKFPKAYNVWEDTHLWLRVVAQYPFYQINEFTCQWNVHKGGTVEKTFDLVRSSHVKNYLNCINHLAKNYWDMLAPFFSKKDFQDYRFKKLKMFLHITFNRRQYGSLGQLFFYGFFKVDSKRVTKFIKYLLSHEIRVKVHSLRTK